MTGDVAHSDDGLREAVGVALDEHSPITMHDDEREAAITAVLAVLGPWLDALKAKHSHTAENARRLLVECRDLRLRAESAEIQVAASRDGNFHLIDKLAAAEAQVAALTEQIAHATLALDAAHEQIDRVKALADEWAESIRKGRAYNMPGGHPALSTHERDLEDLRAIVGGDQT